MKSKENLLKRLESLPYFSKDSVFKLAEGLNLEDSTIDTYISRFLKSKKIFSLKNGLYASADFFSKNKNDISYLFFLANIMRKPSYVSSWAALQYYNLTTEIIHSITSVTPKVTKDYRTRMGNFAYQSIDKRLFSDFNLVKGKFDFFIASPSKALFDLLYFRTNQFRGVSRGRVTSIIEELRIDIDEMDEGERSKFIKIIAKYLHE